MTSKYPAQLDTDAELYRVEDGVDDCVAAHHNALASAIKAIEGHTINRVPSNPPAGSYRVTNIYVTPEGKIQVEYETTPAGGE